jgi:hypothetical protein
MAPRHAVRRSRPVRADLFHILSDEAPALAHVLTSDLTLAQAPHYEQIDPGLLHARCQRLLEAFLASAHGNPRPFVDYVREITEQRIAEGYDLAEIQQALSALERRAWRLAVERSNVENVIAHLAAITSTIGAAKDELARIFLGHKQRAEASLELLETGRLFAGTEGHVEPEQPRR